MRVCSTPGCPTVYDGPQSRCPAHRGQADKARGTTHERGYNTAGHRAFRRAVIERDMVCVLCGLRPSTVADHYPTSRRDLISAGMNPNDPSRGRGLCKPCHDRETAHNQPGGFLLN